ncbi:hypothetical protein, partial [Nocardia farcinica]|uniref:hypothetical protein n=1 Tax=Nocardia farcinica TaxID=37329 RepID=UPI002457D3B8
MIKTTIPVCNAVRPFVRRPVRNGAGYPSVGTFKHESTNRLAPALEESVMTRLTGDPFDRDS